MQIKEIVWKLLAHFLHFFVMIEWLIDQCLIDENKQTKHSSENGLGPGLDSKLVQRNTFSPSESKSGSVEEIDKEMMVAQDFCTVL